MLSRNVICLVCLLHTQEEGKNKMLHTIDNLSEYKTSKIQHYDSNNQKKILLIQSRTMHAQ